MSETKVLNRILGLGFKKEDVVEYKDYYLVEGDICFPKKDSLYKSSTLKQARVNNLVSKTYINVFLEPNFSNLYSNMSDALDGTLAAYNNVGSTLTFSRTYNASNAHIVIRMDNSIRVNL